MVAQIEGLFLSTKKHSGLQSCDILVDECVLVSFLHTKPTNPMPTVYADFEPYLLNQPITC